MDSVNTIKIEGYDVHPAQVNGCGNVFSATNLTFVKSRWIEDDEVGACRGCGLKFTQLRRRHHCRQCGQIFCSKCCNSKVHLSHLEYEDSERVCDNCFPVAELLQKSRSHYVNDNQEAAVGLAKMTNDIASIIKLVEFGGLQTLIFLAKAGDHYIGSSVAAALHTFAQYDSLIRLLIDSGAIKAVTSILVTAQEPEGHSIHQALGCLYIFAKQPQVVPELLENEVLSELVRMCETVSASSLLALRTLNLLIRDPKGCDLTLKICPHLISKLLTLVTVNDQQMQNVSLDCLCVMSAASQVRRDFIIKEDFTCSKPLLNLLRCSGIPEPILSKCLFLLANLTTTLHHQTLLVDHMDAICDIVDNGCYSLTEEILTSMIRGIANFVEYTDKHRFILDHFPGIMRQFLHSKVTFHRFHVLRLIFRLLQNDAASALQALSNCNETSAVLEESMKIPGFYGAINLILTNHAPPLCQPVNELLPF